VVDVHHKPRGLTSLPRCLLSHMHKVQHKPRKKFSWGLKQIWSKRLESVLQVAHQTVSGAPGRTPLKLATLGVFKGALRYNSPDCLMCTGRVWWANRATITYANGRLQKWIVVNSTGQSSEQRSQSMFGVAPDYPVQLQDKGFQWSRRSKPQRCVDVARTG
jgi:hypothetical protein